jgi:hypothetical protein
MLQAGRAAAEASDRKELKWWETIVRMAANAIWQNEPKPRLQPAILAERTEATGSSLAKRTQARAYQDRSV